MPAEQRSRFLVQIFFMGDVSVIVTLRGAVPGVGFLLESLAVAALVEAEHDAAMVRIEQLAVFTFFEIGLAAVGDQAFAVGIEKVMEDFVSAVAAVRGVRPASPSDFMKERIPSEKGPGSSM